MTLLVLDLTIEKSRGLIPYWATIVWLLLTGWSKKMDTQFYFWDNFGNSAPILTIPSVLQAEIYVT